MVNSRYVKDSFMLYTRFKDSVFPTCEYSFKDEPFLSCFCEIYLSINDIKFDQIQIIAKSSSTQKSVCTTSFGPFGEIGANFLHNFYLKHSLLKFKVKNLSPKINVKNIKKAV